MRIVFVILLVYCILATIWLGYLIYGNSQEINSMQQELSAAQQTNQELISARQAAQSELTRLENQLRADRTEIPGNEAIEQSIAIQAADARLNLAYTACNKAVAEATALGLEQQALRSKYLPLVLLLLLHITGSLVFLSFLKPKL